MTCACVPQAVNSSALDKIQNCDALFGAELLHRKCVFLWHLLTLVNLCNHFWGPVSKFSFQQSIGFSSFKCSKFCALPIWILNQIGGRLKKAFPCFTCVWIEKLQLVPSWRASRCWWTWTHLLAQQAWAQNAPCIRWAKYIHFTTVVSASKDSR